MTNLTDIEKIASALTGKLIPGGCDWCEADQKMWRDYASPRLIHVEVQHDPQCPYLLGL